jgi:hypothetical protein
MDRNSLAGDRRRATRRIVSPDEPLSRARLRTGGQLRVVDASSWGALAQLTERLLPGRHLDLHVVAAHGRVLVRARVARAYVWQVHAGAICYRVALAFEHALDIRVEGYAMPASVAASEIPKGNSYPVAAMSTDIEFHDAPSS